MADTIRPTFIGFAFGAVAGIAIGLWYATGMGKLDRAELEKELEVAQADALEAREQAEAEANAALDARSAARDAQTALLVCEKLRDSETPAP